MATPESSITLRPVSVVSSGTTTSNSSNEANSRNSAPAIDDEKQRELILQMLNRACKTGEIKGFQCVFESSPIKIDPSTLKCSEETSTPLLIACEGGYREIVQYLLKHNHSLCEDQQRNSPLHLAAAGGHKEIACDLLEYAANQNKDACESSQCNIFHQLNSKGRSPLGCALLASEPRLSVAKEFLRYAEGKPENTFPDFNKMLFPGFESRSLDKPVNLFVLGDRNCGKSTLICSLQESSSLLAALANRRTVQEGIDKHYTGIIATEFSSNSFQRMICYELAGHTNFFSEKLFESPDVLGNSIFLVIVNLKESQPNTLRRLMYWLNFLHYYTVRSGTEQKPTTLIVGSHADTRTRPFWRSTNRLEQVFEELQKKQPKLVECFEFPPKPVFSVDCRKLASFEMRGVRSALFKLHQKVRPPSAKLPSSMCYVLNDLFSSPALHDQPVLTLGELASKIEEYSMNPDLNPYKLLPTERSELLALCEVLHKNQRLMIFKNPLSNDIESTWIVHNSRRVLTDIDAQLKDLNTSIDSSADGEKSMSSFREAFLTNSGIISRSTLESNLNNMQNLHLDPVLAVQLLQHFKYCELVSISSDSSPSNQYFFLPGLLEDIGIPDPWKGDGFGFAWRIAPSSEQKDVFSYFLPRFLKKLLLSLTQRFVQNPARFHLNEDGQSSDSSAIERSEVGDRAISWLTSNGIHIAVFTRDDEIILNMYCSQPDTELPCLQLRNYIVSTIREQRDLWQPEVGTTEFLIPFGEKFPVQKSEHYQSVSLDNVRQAMMKGREDYDGISFQSVVFHDPCIILSKLDKPSQLLLSDTQNLDKHVSEDLLKKISQIIGSKKRHLYAQLQLPLPCASTPPLDSCRPEVEVQIESDEEHPYHTLTHEDLLGHFDSFSICKSLQFLKEIQDLPANGAALSGEDLIERDITPFDRRPSEAFTISPSDFVIVQPRVQLPYINAIKHFTCDSEGLTVTSEPHGIVVKIPPGAVAKSTSRVNLEFGVLLSGPFEFPPDVRLVSPILSLNMDVGSKFNRSIDISLPHCVDFLSSDESKNLVLYKCTPSEALSDIPFMLTLSSKEQVKLTPNSALVSTKHTGFFCICCKMSEEMVTRAKFSIVSVMPKEDNITDNTFTIHVFVTLALRTCFELVVKKHPGCNYVRKNFKFKQPALDHEAAIEINFERFLRTGWMVALGCFQREILLREACPFNTMDDANDYPPEFTINISGEHTRRCEMLQLSFSGATRPLSSEYLLKHTGWRFPSHQSSVLSLQAMQSTSAALVPTFLDRHHTTIVQMLNMNEISPYLTELRILTSEETDTLLKRRTQYPGMASSIVTEELVRMLKTKGAEGFRRFVSALEQTTDGTGHRDILRTFEEDPDYEHI